jgi:hypothetical protein
MRLDFKARASGGFRSDGVDAAVIDLGDCTARDADQVMVVGWFARDVGMSAVGKVNPFNQVLVGEEFKETEDSGAPNAEAALIGICNEVGSGEVPLPARNEGGELPARPGKANPRLVKCLEQLSSHGGILPELRLGLNRRWGAPNRAHGASTGMIHL